MQRPLVYSVVLRHTYKIIKLLCKECPMAQSVSVKVSSRYQIAVPRVARERLNI